MLPNITSTVSLATLRISVSLPLTEKCAFRCSPSGSIAFTQGVLWQLLL